MKSPDRIASASSLFARLARLFILLSALGASASAATVALPEALDTPALSWLSSGTPADRLWTGQTTVVSDGADAAQTPLLANEEEESWIETTVVAPATLSWKWRLDLGDEQASTLEFYVGDDTSPRQSLVQTAAWTAAAAVIDGSGPVRVRWRFSRAFPAERAAADVAYLDTVVHAPFDAPVLGAATGVNARGFTVNWTAPAASTGYVLEWDASADFATPERVVVAAPASSYTLTGLTPLATYHYRLIAQGPELLESVSLAASVTLPAVQRPVNDAFSSPVSLGTTVSGTLSPTTLDATVEAGEPVAHETSVWFTWAAPSAGRWRFTAAYAATGALGSPAMYVYSGATLSSLALLASHDGAGVVEFDAAAGVPLRIALDSIAAEAGPITFSWTRLATYTPPANDTFASGIRLSTASGETSGTNLYAGVESGEPDSAGAHTVWWRWTAPSTGLATFSTPGSAIPVTLAAYTGTTLSNLVLVGSGSGALAFPTSAGTTYHLALSGEDEAQGAIQLRWSLAVASQTQTVAFTAIGEHGIHDEPFQVFATTSSGLPVVFSLVSGPATISGDIVTLGGSSGTVRLRATQSGDGVYLPASAETTFTVRAAPANDTFAAAFGITGASGSTTGNTLSAGAQDFDPFPANHSIWWRWIAPATGVLTLDTAGSSITTTLAVVTGTPGADYAILAESNTPGVRARLVVPVTKGETYRIAVDSLDQQGAVVLAWSLAEPSITQTITFAALPDVGVDADPIILDAYSDSGLPVTIALVSAQTTAGVATLSDGVLSFTGAAGRVTLRASQTGDEYYKPAQTDVSFNVLAPPANDAFASAALLSGSSGSVTGNTLSASRQDFDPFPANHSVWWRWVAPATGVLTLDTAGSSITTTLAVVTGAPGADYAILAESGTYGVRARLELPVTKGVTYRIAVDSYEQQGAIVLAWSLAEPSLTQTITFAALPDVGVDAAPITLDAYSDSGLPVTIALVSDQTTAGVATLSAEGVLSFTGKTGQVTLRASQAGDAYYKSAQVDVSFNVRPPPANDAFAAAIALAGASGVTTGANVDASAELTDPFPASHSVWWRWTAPSVGVLTLDTAGSGVFTTMSVFTGNDATALEPVAASVEPAAHARLEFPVVSGQTYRIVIDSHDNAQGSIRLAWSLAKPSRSQTITFDPLSNLVAGDPAFEINATASSGLPVSLAVVSGPATLADDVVTLTHQAGTVTIRATQAGDADYQAAPAVTRSFKVAKAPAIKFTFIGLAQTYDGDSHPVIAAPSSDPRHTPVAVTYSGSGYPASTEPPVHAGTYTVTATADSSKQTAKLVVAKAPLTVIALDQEKLAGAPLPELTLAYFGFIGGDDETSLTRAPVATTSAKATSPGGSYTIKVSGGVSTDYAFTYVPGRLDVGTLAGAYEARLDDPYTGLPVGKLELTIASRGDVWTGKLTLASEPATFSVKGPLIVDSDLGSAAGTLDFVRGANTYRLELSFPLDARFSASLSLADEVFGATHDGRALFIPAKKEQISWSGAHTALLYAPQPLDPADTRSIPAGFGAATAAIDTKGKLKLAGTLADGTKLTATLAPDTVGAYRLFALPYGKRLQSRVAGTLAFEEHPDLAGRRRLADASLVWTKAALPASTKASAQDKSHRLGFDLALSATIDPWLPPVTKTSKTAPAIITLAQRLDLADRPTDAASLAIEIGPNSEAYDFGALADRLPTLLGLSVKNTLALAAPVTTPANAAKFTISLTASTGAFKGTFTLSDQVPAPTSKNPEATKTETRKISFTGVLRQPPAAEADPLLGGGAFLLKPLSTAGTTESLSGRLLLVSP